MKELVEIIAKALVDNPDEVVVTETEKDKALVVNLKVAPSDMGKVIGKSGRIAKSIRAVVSAAASKSDKKVIRQPLGAVCFVIYIYIYARMENLSGRYVKSRGHYIDPRNQR